MQDFIAVTNAPTNQFLAQDYFTPGPTVSPDEVRGDSQVAFSIQPVTVNPGGALSLYSEDFDTSDVLTMGLGNFDQPPTAGTMALQANGSTTGLTSLAYNVSAAALQTGLNAAIVAGGGGFPQCTVTLIAAGVYNIVGVSNATIATGSFVVTNAGTLFPISTVSFYEGSLGTASTPYVVTMVVVQSALCYAEATALLADPDAALSTVQAGSGTANKIQNLTFTPGTYGGSVVITAVANSVTATCGTIVPGMTITQVGAVLANHPEIEYNNTDGTTPNNVVITIVGNGYNFEFVDTLGNSNANALSIASQSINGPMGKSGVIDYNTSGLLEYSYTKTGDSFPLQRQIQRSRSSGEIRTIYLDTVTVWKSVLNAATATPTPVASYYTSTQVDALLALKVSGPVSATANAIPLFNGTTGKIIKDGPLPTTVGAALITLTNPSAIRFIRIDAGNTVTALTAAAMSLAITTVVVLTSDGVITIQDSDVFLEKTSGGAFTIAAPSSQDGMRITIIGNTDFAHVVTFTGSTLLDGTTGANLTATFTAFKGSSITVVARGAFWLVEALNLVVCAP